LIDFWASWCGPCRKENPHITEMYRKFKDKNFEIFGVSLDDNLGAWREAIKKDHLTWPQVSELRKWDSGVVKNYQIEAIPFSVLIDKEGKIIAKGLSSDEIEEKLLELL
jgi:thiol-disulfide isomerase/thioredoxin